MVHDPNHTPSINRDVRAAIEFMPFIEAFILLRASEFSLTPGALVLVLANLRRMVIDRRTPLGKTLAEIAGMLPETDPPNPRNVRPIPRRSHRRDHE